MTYGAMQQRIANEIKRSDLSVQIQNAITDAIKLYASVRFWFNEMRDGEGILQGDDETSITTSNFQQLTVPNSLTTVKGQEFYNGGDYPALNTMSHFDKMVVVYGGNVRYTLHSRTPQWIDDMATSTVWMGMPTDFSWSAMEIRLYPIPDGAYPIYTTGTGRFPLPKNTYDTSPWFTIAERLTRCTAKRMLYAEIIRDMNMAQLERQNELEYLATLKRETATRGGRPRLRVRDWF